MTDIKTELEEMKKKLENLEREKIKVETRREQLLEQLKALDINSLEEGRVKLAEMLVEQEAAEIEAVELLKKFKTDYVEFI